MPRARKDEKRTTLYEQAYLEPGRFKFGQNWLKFQKTINEDVFDRAKRSVIEFLGGEETIIGKRVIDLGCGSGLFSSVLYSLGAKNL